MLVLSRRIGESLKIGNDVELIVLGIDHRGQVRLGFEAPKTTHIVRTELLDLTKQASDIYSAQEQTPPSLTKKPQIRTLRRRHF